MNYKNFLFVFLSLFISDCNKESTTEPTDALPAIDLLVGNQYLFNYGEFSGIVYFDWFMTTHILRDTIIEENKYFIFSSGEIARTTSTTVFLWNGYTDIIWYRFDVELGDDIIYFGKQLKVTSITTDAVFVGTQKIISASNADFTPDTTITIRYATKFGILSTSKMISDKRWGSRLEGAKINSIKYGNYFP